MISDGILPYAMMPKSTPGRAEVLTTLQALTKRSAQCAELVSGWIDEQLMAESGAGFDVALRLLSPPVPALSVGADIYVREAVPVLWSRSLSASAGLKFSADLKQVNKTGSGPDYETAIGEHVISKGCSSVTFKMTSRVDAVKIGVVEDGFSTTGRDIMGCSEQFCFLMYSDGGSIKNKLSGQGNNSTRFQSFSVNDTVTMTIDFFANKITFKKGAGNESPGFAFKPDSKFRIACNLDYSNETVVIGGNAIGRAFLFQYLGACRR